MFKVGIVGWRGMVGSVLIQRMHEENDFESIDAHFFSTSQSGEKVNILNSQESSLLDAFDIDELIKMDILLSCQGGDYTKKILNSLREKGWSGHWIDAASTLRMDSDAMIVLDPINKDAINTAIKAGNKNWVGGNCTVSLMLLAIHGLFKNNLVEWVSSMTYQAASGAGAQNMKELLMQMCELSGSLNNIKPDSNILELDKDVQLTMNSEKFTKKLFTAPLAGSLIPWIDADLGNGQSREEWKAQAETNKILGREESPIAVEGICVRIGAMRCHSQALTFKLSDSISVSEVEKIVNGANEWAAVVPNEKAPSISMLSPTNVTRTFSIPVGRIRKLNIPDNVYSAFTVGDQLLWGAAEPLRRMLCILIQRDR